MCYRVIRTSDQHCMNLVYINFLFPRSYYDCYAPTILSLSLFFSVSMYVPYLYVRPYIQKLISVSYFSLPEPNFMKLICNAYNHKTQVKFEFCWRHFYNSRCEGVKFSVYPIKYIYTLIYKFDL